MKFELTGTTKGMVFKRFLDANERIQLLPAEPIILPWKLKVSKTVAMDDSISGSIWEGKLDPPIIETFKQGFGENVTVSYRTGKDRSGKIYEVLKIEGETLRIWHTDCGQQKEFFQAILSIQTWDRKEVHCDLNILEKGGRGRNRWCNCEHKSTIATLDEKSQAVLVDLFTKSFSAIN